MAATGKVSNTAGYCMQVSSMTCWLFYSVASVGALAWQTIQPILVKAGIECILLLTERPRHATEYAQTKPLDDIDCIVAIGGDGYVTVLVILSVRIIRADGTLAA